MKLLSILLTIPLSAALCTAADKKPADTKAPAKKAPPANLQPNPKKLNPPPGVVVPAEVKAELTAGAAALGKEIESLRVRFEKMADDHAINFSLLADVQIFHNAVRYALEDDIFTSTNQFNSARALLKQGNERAAALKAASAAALKAGNVPWNTKAGLLAVKKGLESKAKAPTTLTHVPVVRGYRSKIDGSVQPYGLLIPADYLANKAELERLDVWLHGRGDTLNEIAFIEGRQRPGSEFLPANTIVLHPYGRFMNAFKFAGEVDVFECIEDTLNGDRVDTRHDPKMQTIRLTLLDPKIAMRGFSMGGAGAWHLGAHYPGEFAAVNPGAGFVDVKNYQKLGDKLATIPWWEQKLWNLYDPLACPINLINTKLVAYSGEDDAQKSAADLMEAAFAKEGVKMTHIIGPKTGHAYEPKAKAIVAKLVDEAVNSLPSPWPRREGRFVTYTLKYNQTHWLWLLALEEHWKESRVDVEIAKKGAKVSFNVKTRNVRDFGVNLYRAGLAPSWGVSELSVVIDGERCGQLKEALLEDSPWFRATKTAGKWSLKTAPALADWDFESQLASSPELVKRQNLQGPIDDAFMNSFVMVRPTGQPLNAAVGQWAKTELAEAAFHWRRYFRGEPRVKDDSAITDADIASNNLVLFGDPSSNKLLARIADKLPIQWSAAGIKVGGKTYDATKHAPAFIFPNPLNPSRYVVINSGFTFPQYAGASNSQQTPKLPDWAILDLSVPLAERTGGKGVVAADFFGEKWELK